MYSLPSTSMMRDPLPRAMNGGVPPTLRKARTGELTPPGMTLRAAANRASERERLTGVFTCDQFAEEEVHHDLAEGAVQVFE